MAKTETFLRIEEFRKRTGRSVGTGQKRRQASPRITSEGLIIRALRIACQVTTRDDLRPHYRSLAEGLAAREDKRPQFSDGLGI